MPIKKVLVIEDDPQVQRTISRILMRKKCESIPAFTVNEARILFNEHSNELCIIIFDGSLERDGDTLPLVIEFQASFLGPMIAISANKSLNINLMRAGCTHTGTKPYIIKPIFDALAEI